MLLVQEKMCYVLAAMILASWSQSLRATFTCSQSYSTSLCHANSHNSEKMQGTDCVREEVEAFYKDCDLPDVPDDVDVHCI